MNSPLPQTHGLSINIYGRGDATLGDGPSHMGIALYEFNSSSCDIYHIRNPDDMTFIYDPRTQPLEDPVLRGRCEVISMTAEQVNQVDQLLSAFGEDKSKIPELGVGNCQNWVAGAMAVLERAGLLEAGEGEFWRSMINRSAAEMKDMCLDTGRTWIPGPENTFEGVPDARFSDGRGESGDRPVGKLAQNPALRDRMQSLLEKRQPGQISEQQLDSEKVAADPIPDRPFYVSSPFFSRVS
ncbi:hypothetical protein BJX99DRAFT_229850 [Aspergillus californicus]